MSSGISSFRLGIDQVLRIEEHEVRVISISGNSVRLLVEHAVDHSAAEAKEAVARSYVPKRR